MLEVNKNNIPDQYKWFSDKLNENFKLLIGDRSQVIFGFNGIGKSTLYNIIKSMNFDSVDFMDYNHSNNSIINGKEIKLSYHINEIAKLKAEIDRIKEQLQVSERIKNNGLTTIALRKNINTELNNYIKSVDVPSFKSSIDEVKHFNLRFPNLDMKAVFTFYSELSKVNKVEEELDKNKKNIIYKALELIKSSADMSQSECPLCGSSVDWQIQLENKLQELSLIKSELIEKYGSKKFTIDCDELNRQVEAVKYLSNNKNLAFDLAIAPTYDEYLLMEKLVNDYQVKTNEMKALLINAQHKYELVLSKKHFLEADMKRYFNVESSMIAYDDTEFIISISFPRDIKTYSTGEINLITFLYSIYSFLGSDNEVLVLDDPVSSLDMINQYKIAFEIVSNINPLKHMLVFTHSTDFLNIINSQHQKQFKYSYLEESDGIIYLDEINFVSSNNNPNVISIDKIKGYDNEGLLEYIKSRDNNLQIDYEVFHYDNSEHFINNDSTKISNYKLIKLIDEFSRLSHTSFYDNAYNKIKYLIAIRVWIEKQLYLSIPDNDNSKQSFYLSKNTLEERIDLIIPRGSCAIINGKTIKREMLMCKKVMLNQGVHYNSQVSPLSYAINLSLDDLSLEIESIRKLF